MRVKMSANNRRRRNDERSGRALKVSELSKREKVEEYQERLEREWTLVRDLERVDVEEEWQRFKSAVLECTERVCGMRRVGGGVRKGGEWWCEEVGVAVKGKKQAFEMWLQRKDEASYEAYKEKRRLVKRAVRNAKVRADERWGNKLTENFQGNKKMFWKEVKRVRKGKDGKEERVKAEDGTVLVENRQWKRGGQSILKDC